MLPMNSAQGGGAGRPLQEWLEAFSAKRSELQGQGDREPESAFREGRRGYVAKRVTDFGEE